MSIFQDHPLEKLISYLYSPTPSESSSKSSFLQPILDFISQSNHPLVAWAKISVETARGEIIQSITEFKEGWSRLALGDGSNERGMCVVIGYLVIGIGVAFYLNVLNIGTVKSAGRAVRGAINQQLLVVKVSALYDIKRALVYACEGRRIYCHRTLLVPSRLWVQLGFLLCLDASSRCDASNPHRVLLAISSHLDLLSLGHWDMVHVRASPFYVSDVGSNDLCYRHQFASLLAGSRTIMRPGAMWFIKDPSDQNFHPIRDILDRPSLVQLRKLSVSAIMYSLVVAGGVGSVGGLMKLMAPTLLPIRWKPRYGPSWPSYPFS